MKSKHPSPYDCINVGEEDELIVEGYMPSHFRLIIFISLVLLSGGMILLVIAWKPSIRFRISHNRCSLDQATTLVLRVLLFSFAVKMF